MRWIDVGCGSGAFSELLLERCAPAEVRGIDPSEAQLAFARAHLAGRSAEFQCGDALSLPFGDDHFDAAVMARVIFFVPDPSKGLAEMLGGGHPLELLRAEINSMGFALPNQPRSDVSEKETLHSLWMDAGLELIEVREFAVQRTFPSFESFWATSTTTPSVRQAISQMRRDDFELLKGRMRARLPADDAGSITCTARANAITGRVPREPRKS
jgi:SAM-dependent methyltransferase